MNLFTLAAKLTINTAEFNAQIAKADDKGKAFAEGLGNAFSKMAKAAVISLAAVGTAATALVVKLGKTGFEYNLQMERYTTNFKVLLGSAEAAAAKVEELKRMAAKTPFMMGDLADATQTLLSFQVSANETTDILKMLGDISLGDSQKLSGLALVFGQVASAGKLAGQDLMQFINQGFNPLNYIAQRTGETMEQLRKRMSDGKVTVQEVKQAMIDATSEGGQFYGGMEEGSKTVSGQWSTLKENWNAFLGKIMEPVNLEVGNSIIPALLEGLGKISKALFGVEEDANEAKKALFTDENGTETDPSGNLSTWFTDLLAVWSDGEPEDDKIVKSFVDSFKSNTKSIVEVLQGRIDDVTGAYTDEEKEEMQKQIDRLHELDTEVESLLEKRKNNMLTEEDKTRLQQMLSEIAAIQASVEHLTAADVDIGSWFENLKIAFTSGGKADDEAVKNFASAFNHDTDLITEALQQRIEDMTGAVSDSDKEEARAALAEISSIQDEVNSILAAASERGYFTDDEIKRLGELSARFTELKGSLGFESETNKALSPWERFISKLSGMAVDGIDKLSTLIADFLSDPENIETVITDLTDFLDDLQTVAEGIASVFDGISSVVDVIKEAWKVINGESEIKTLPNSFADLLEVYGTFGNDENPTIEGAWQFMLDNLMPGDTFANFAENYKRRWYTSGEVDYNPDEAYGPPLPEGYTPPRTQRTMTDILRDKANSYLDEDEIFGTNGIADVIEQVITHYGAKQGDALLRKWGLFGSSTGAGWGDEEPGGDEGWSWKSASEDISGMSTSLEGIAEDTSDNLSTISENMATSEDIIALTQDILNRPLEVNLFLNGTEFSNAIAKDTRSAQNKLSRRLTLGKGTIPGVTNGKR